MLSIRDRQERLFGRARFVCGGHGAWNPSAGDTTVPPGMTLYFYTPHGTSLDNSLGMTLDSLVAGAGGAPRPCEVVSGGQRVRNYHLFCGRAGSYLNLAMSSQANPNYITTTDRTDGRALSEILAEIARKAPFADVHWAACRDVSTWGGTMPLVAPTYSQDLLALGKPKGGRP